MNRPPDRLRDALIALLLTAVGLIGTAPAARFRGVTDVTPWAYALVVVAALALTGRRPFPLTTLAVTASATAVYLVLGYPPGPIVFSQVIAVYTVAAHRPLRPAALYSGAALATLMICGWAGAGFDLDGFVPPTAWVAVPFAVGVTVRTTREQTRRSRHDEARRQADAERLRVAQEVHDVVGHGLAAITMQAEIALHLLTQNRPPDVQPGSAGWQAAAANAESALTAISRTSRESLDELRATLGAVRRGADLDDRAPVPGVARLDVLADRTRAVGIPVTIAIDGPVDTLPAAVDLVAYRIVQESLTNVLRHAGPATAEVHLSRRDNVLTVAVTDDGVPTRSRRAHASPGHGLAGMTERVTALGGNLTAGPRPGGGFTVTATIPTPPDPPATR